jgi:peptidyl-prolyl cis-trans isomerase C
MIASTLKRISTLLSLFLVFSLTACGLYLEPAATHTPTPSLTPTETPIPMAVMVNGEGITLDEFNAELERYQQAQNALGNTVDTETATQTVGDDLINTLLLAQGAAAGGYRVEDATLQSKIDTLASQIGGDDALSAWETANGYTDADFRSALQRQLNAIWMRDRLVSAVPTIVEQVHVKQILLYNADKAQQKWDALEAGSDFNDLAALSDPATQGELGWFPRGYLPEKIIEETAFTLEDGQYSEVIQTQAGYHILYLVERDPARLLSPDALLTLQERAITDWLTQQRAESTILFTP